MKKCQVKNCNRKFYGKELCHAHYVRMKRTGSTQEHIKIKKVNQPIIERFKEKIAPSDKNGCQNWIGCLSDGRYGAFIIGSRINGTRKRCNAHRLSYELFVGKIPEGMCILHKCDNVKCVNPKHLFLGTQKDNMKDMQNKGRAFYSKEKNQ